MSVPQATDRTPGRPRGLRPRRNRWLKLGAVVLLAGWFTHFAYTRITRKPTPRPEYWIKQLEALYTPRPGAMTVAHAEVVYRDPASELLYQQAIQANPSLESLPPWKSHPGRIPHDIDYEPRRQCVFDSVYDLRLDSRTPGWEVSLLAQGGSRGPVSDLRLRGIDWLACLCLTRYDLSDPSPDFLVEDAWGRQATAVEIMRAALLESEVPKTVLSALSDEILDHPLLPGESLELFRIPAMMQLESIYVSDGGWIDVSEMIMNYGGRLHPLYMGSLGTPTAPVSPLWNLISPLFDSFEESVAKLDALLSPARHSGTITRCQQLLAELPLQERRITILNGIYFPFSRRQFVEVAQVQLIAQASLEAGLTMLALCAYHQHHGTYPPSLDALVPEFIPRPPVDHAVGSPLVYRRTGNGRYLLYSLGLNGVDDGGVADADDPVTFKPANLDVVFTAVQPRETLP